VPGEPRLRFERMFLHARRLGFTHPATGERITLDAAMPGDCQTLLDRLARLDATTPQRPAA
jgi:23S rRNA pseudouridine955/2504/2580 synthase